MSAGTARGAALQRLRDGMVTIHHAEVLGGLPVLSPPTVVVAAVTSGRDPQAPPHRVDLHNDRWTCTCDTYGICPHMAAVMLITGHGGPAAKAAAA